MSSDYGKNVSLRYSQLYLDDIHAETPEGIESEKADCVAKIKEMREKLAMLIAGNPKDLMSKYDIEEGNPQTWITENIDEIETELGIQYRKLERLDILDNILFEWEHGRISDSWEDMTPDLNPREEDSKRYIFPEDVKQNESEHYAIMFGRKTLDDDSLNEMYAKCKANLSAEDFRRETIENSVCALVDGQLFVTYLGQWVFPNEEEAFKAVKNKLNIPTTDYINKRFIKEHKAFFIDAINNCNDEDAKLIMKYLENVSNDTQCDMGLMTEFYDAVMRCIDSFLKKHIKFYIMKYQLALSELTNK